MRTRHNVSLGVLLFLLVYMPGLAQGPELVLQGGHSGQIDDLAFSPDGRWLASTGDGVYLWELTTGRVWRKLAADGEIAFSPDGRYLATPAGRTIKIWEVETGRVVHTLEGHTSPVNTVAFSPDGELLASGAGDWIENSDDYTVRLWNVDSGREARRLTGHASDVNSVAFSPDGNWLASSGYDKTARIWDVSTGREAHTLSEHTGWIRSVAFSPDGRLLATASDDKTIKLWEAGSGQVIRTLTHDLTVTTVRFSPDGRWLASAAYNEDIKMWEVETGREVHQLRGRVGALAFSPDGRWLATKTPGGSAIKLWEVGSWREVQTLGGRVATPFALAMSSDGQWLASSVDRTLVLREAASGRVINTLTGHRGAVLKIAFSPQAHWLASGDNQGVVKVWDVASGRELHTLRHEGIESIIGALAFSPDESLLATGIQAGQGRPVSGLANNVKVWEVDTGHELVTLTGHTDAVRTLAFSPDGSSLASASGGFTVSGQGDDNTIRIWDVSAGRERQTLAGHARAVNAVAFSPDGRLLASGGGDLGEADNSVRLWDVSTGRELMRGTGHTGAVYAVAFSPDNRLVSGDRDGMIILWENTRTDAQGQSGLRVERTLTGHTGSLRNLVFTPDGSFLLSGSMDGSIRLWNWAQGEEVALLATMRESDDWAVVSPNGLFDGSAQGMQELVAWRMGRRTYPPDRFFTDFYTPGLLTRLLAGERPEPELDLAALRPPPDVRILSPTNNSTPEQRQIEVTVETEDQGGGVAEVRLYHNGKLVDTRPGRPGTQSTYMFQVMLVAGENELRASALSDDEVESNEDWVRMTPARGVVPVPEGPVELAPATLHMLVVGINRYADSAFNLGFARPDAEAIATFFGQPGELFSTVNRLQLFDEEATRANIREALDELAQKAQPEDVLLIYLAGHGVTLGQQFYFLPHEMRLDTGDEEGAVRRYGMPATELGDTLFRTRALKQVLIIDACQSEGALGVLATTLQRSPGAQQKALKMLARSKGVYLVAASTKQQYAFEVPELGHGVLTFSLLCGLGEQGLPCELGERGEQQAATEEGIVTMSLLLDYISWQVPELTEKYHASQQFPVVHSHGMNFPLWVHR